jgi:CDP-diacylglycerol--serine O-phosphatidyltransferase
MATPAAAGFVAAVVFFDYGQPIHNVYLSVIWLALLAFVGLLMVSTWRYPSLKQINIGKPRSPLVVLLFGLFIYLIWNWAQTVLLIIAVAYVGSGIFIRLGGIVRRRLRKKPRRDLAT